MAKSSTSGIGRQMKGLSELAAEEGYQPHAFTIRRQKELEPILEDWRRDLARGLVPPFLAAEMGIHDVRCAWGFIRSCERDFIEADDKLAPFVYPKLRTVDTNLTANAGESLVELLTRANERDRKTD